MRSFVSKAALAVLVVSSTLGVAAAQNMSTGQSSTTMPSMSSGQATTTTDQSTMQPGQTMRHKMPSKMMHHAAMSHQAMKPRMTMISSELSKVQRRIDADSHKGSLTRAERRDAERNLQQIRANAMATANRHSGSIPSAQYARYQRDIQKLNGMVHRLSTNSRSA